MSFLLNDAVVLDKRLRNCATNSPSTHPVERSVRCGLPGTRIDELYAEAKQEKTLVFYGAGSLA
jgi:hypothetical protein